MIMSNIKGLGDYDKNKDKDAKKKKETFIGGEKSALAVEDHDDDDLQKIVNIAKKK